VDESEALRRVEAGTLPILRVNGNPRLFIRAADVPPLLRQETPPPPPP
jgi:hypothetical protein